MYGKSRSATCVILSLSILLVVNARIFAAVIGGPVINPANDNTYYLLEPGSWTASEAEAVSLGGHLVAIGSEEETVWVATTFSNFNGGSYPYLWIGFSDALSEGTYEWSNGEDVTYTNWAPGEPNGAFPTEDYAHIIVDWGNGEWVDRRDSDGTTIYGVVEVPTGTVSYESTTWGSLKTLYRD